MPVNKVVFGDRTLIDLTSDTVSADKLAKGVTAHDKTGEQITGTMESGGSSEKYGATLDTFLGDVNVSGVLQAPTAQTDLVFDGVTDLANSALQYKFYENPTIKTVSFPNLVQISGALALQQCFYNAQQIEAINFPVLKSISGNSCFGYAFQNNKSILSIEFPSLISISGVSTFYGAFKGNNLTSCSFPVLEKITELGTFNGSFQNCYALTSAQFPKLKQIGDDNTTSRSSRHFSNTFSSCSKLTTLEFPELTSIYCSDRGDTEGTFYGNNTIQKMYFPKLTVIDKSPAYTGYSTSQNYIFSGCNSLTELHFGAANQAAIEAKEGYPTLWGRGAGKATVYFDL